MIDEKLMLISASLRDCAWTVPPSAIAAPTIDGLLSQTQLVEKSQKTLVTFSARGARL